MRSRNPCRTDLPCAPRAPWAVERGVSSDESVPSRPTRTSSAYPAVGRQRRSRRWLLSFRKGRARCGARRPALPFSLSRAESLSNHSDGESGVSWQLARLFATGGEQALREIDALFQLVDPLVELIDLGEPRVHLF